MFRWNKSTIDELVEHILDVSAQDTSNAIAYYRRKGDVDTVERLKYARRLALQKRLMRRTEALTEQEE